MTRILSSLFAPFLLSFAVVGAVAQPISVGFDGDFSAGPRVRQVKSMVRLVMSKSISRCDRCEVLLSGKPSACNIYFTLYGVKACRRPETGRIRRISGRIPLGNILMIASGRLAWPASVVIKDLTVEIDGARFSSLIGFSGVVSRCRVLFPGESTHLLRKLEINSRNCKRIYKKCLRAGLALAAGGETLRNTTGKALLHVSGRIPAVLGELDVECIGCLHGGTGGRLAFTHNFLAVGGRVLDECPEGYLADETFSGAFDSVRSLLDDAFVCAGFVDSASVDERGHIVISGLALLGLLEQVSSAMQKKRMSSVYRGPTLDLNIYR